MKVFSILAAVSLSLASVGLAQAADLTRAEVVEQLRTAQSQGLVVIGEQSNYPNDRAVSTLSRAEVVNALRLAQVQDDIAFGEMTSYPQTRSGNSSKTRAQVLTELATAQADGLVIIGESGAHPL